jgi:hypothetical protein
LSYVAGFRRQSGYDPNAYKEVNQNQPDGFSGSASQLPTLRKFDEGDRNQQVVNLMLQVTPNDKLTFTPAASYKYIDYISSGLFAQQAAPLLHNQSLLGLQQVVGWDAGMDINWAPTDRISFSVGYVHESLFRKQRNRKQWSQRRLHGLDLEQHRHHRDRPRVDQGRHRPREVVLQDRRGVFPDPRALSRRTIPNCTGSTVCGAAANIPERRSRGDGRRFYDSLAHVRRRAGVQLHQGLGGEALLRLRDSSSTTNWQTGALTPSLTPNANGSVFLGQNWQNYTAQIVGVTLKYKFE